MAIIRNRKAATSTSSANEAWRATAFLNINIVGRSNVKLGAIALRESNASEAKVLAWINGDASKAASLVDKFIITYNAVGQSETGIDFLDELELNTDDKAESDVIGYINLALPTEQGSARLSSIALKHGVQVHEKLAVWLENKDNIEVLQTRMNVVYQSAQGKAADFMLD